MLFRNAIRLLMENFKSVYKILLYTHHLLDAEKIVIRKERLIWVELLKKV